jgi:hypothetical protein
MVLNLTGFQNLSDLAVIITVLYMITSKRVQTRDYSKHPSILHQNLIQRDAQPLFNPTHQIEGYDAPKND